MYLTMGYVLYCFLKTKDAEQLNRKEEETKVCPDFACSADSPKCCLTTAFKFSPSCFAFQTCFKIKHFSYTSTWYVTSHTILGKRNYSESGILQPANFMSIYYRHSASLLLPYFLPSSKLPSLFSLCLMSPFISSFLLKYILRILGTCSRGELCKFFKKGFRYAAVEGQNKTVIW